MVNPEFPIMVMSSFSTMVHMHWGSTWALGAPWARGLDGVAYLHALRCLVASPGPLMGWQRHRPQRMMATLMLYLGGWGAAPARRGTRGPGTHMSARFSSPKSVLTGSWCHKTCQ